MSYTEPDPPNVSLEGDILNKVASFKFVLHNITNEKKFPELAWEKYFCGKSVMGT
jgi:hypothetical protein